MKKYIIIALLFITSRSYAQKYYHLFSIDTGFKQETASTNVMTKRIIKDAVEYSHYAPIPRMAEIDMAFGVDLTEFDKMQGYGVLYIPSLNQDSTEYPIKRVYLKNNSRIIELKEIGEIKIPVKDEQIIHSFGKNRVDYYYLIPYHFTLGPCELLIDWNKNRKEFVLTKFPNNTKLDFVNDNASPGDPKKIDAEVLKKFLIREYNISME